MRKWRSVAALLAVWAGAAAPAFAQCCAGGPCCATAPTPYGAARFQDPIPCSCSPELVPGPLGPEKLPEGPADCLSLNPSTAGAFMCGDEYERECAVFFDVVAMALLRKRFGNQPLAV